MYEINILEIIKSGFILEIANSFKIKENEIIVKLANGSLAKITTKNVA